MADSVDQFLDSGSADHFLDADQLADHFLDQQPKTTLQKVASASAMPMQGLRGIGVGAESLIEGKGAQPSLEAASEAMSPDYKSKPGEKIGAFAGEMVDPRFMAFGAVGESIAGASALAKAVLGGATALGGVKATEEVAEGGTPTLKGTGVQAVAGAAGGAVLHGVSEALRPVMQKAGMVLKDLLSKKDPSSFGKVAKAGEAIVQQISEGKSLEDISKELGSEHFYHGSGTPGISKIDPDVTSHEGLFGQGFYVTSNMDVAKSYAKLRSGGGSGHIYETILKEGNVINLEDPIQDDFKDIIIEQAKLISKTFGYDFPGMSNEPSAGRLVEGIKSGAFKNNEDLFKAFREMISEISHEQEIPTSEFVEDFQELTDKFRKKGYDALTYTGGLRQGIGKFPEHKVMVVLNPEMVSSLRTISPEELQKVVDVFEKSKDHVVDTEMLPVIDKAMKGDQPSQLEVLQKSLKNFYSSPTEASSMAENLFKRRYSDVALGQFESQLFRRDTLKGLSDVDRQALPFILEKKVPEDDYFFHDKKQQILQTAKGYLENPEKYPALKQAAEKIGAYLDEGHKFLKEYYDDIGFREDYINHIWEKPPEIGGSGPGKGSLSQYNPFSKQRFIASYADGINQGLEPKTLDIDKLLGIYDNFKIKTVANAKFVDALKDIKVEGGLPAIMDAEKAPAHWQIIDNSALNKKRLIPGEDGKPGFFTTRPVKVSPEVAPAVRAIIDRPFQSLDPGPHASLVDKAFYHGVNAYEYVNSISKKLKLSLSFFHHYALAETSILAGDPLTPFRVIGKESKQILDDAGMNPTELYKSFRDGHAAFRDIPLSKDAIEHGLNLGPIGDVQTNRVEKLFVEAESGLNKIAKGFGKVITPIRKFNEVWDKALWDYYAAGMKLDLYQRQLEKNIKKFGDKVPLEKIKRDTTDFINKAAGGSFETIMASPRYKQVLQWGLLAPDWTIGRLQLFGTVFKPGVQGSMGRKFWIKAAIAYVTAVNGWNYINTKRDGLVGSDGQPGRFLWDNEEGRKLHLYLDKDPDTGRNIYILPAKAVTEVIGWAQEPMKTLGRKAAPALQMIAEAMYGKFSGRSIVPQEEKTVGGFLKRYIMPIGADQKSSFMMTFPKSFGMSKSQIIQMIQRGYESNNMDMVGSGMGWAAENNFDAKELQQIAYQNYKSGVKKAALLQ